MSIVIKEIHVRTTVEKALETSPELTAGVLDKLKSDLKRELLRTVRKEWNLQQGKKR